MKNLESLISCKTCKFWRKNVDPSEFSWTISEQLPVAPTTLPSITKSWDISISSCTNPESPTGFASSTIMTKKDYGCVLYKPYDNDTK